MAIKPNFTKDDVRKRFDAFLNEIEKKQIARLQRLGEMCLVEARTNKGYMMQTGALLSSTGYEVFVDGVAIHSQFDAASGAESNAAETGIKSGQSIAETIGKGTKGIALVVVAGMNYAAYVEAKDITCCQARNTLQNGNCPECWRNLFQTSNVRQNDRFI